MITQVSSQFAAMMPAGTTTGAAVNPPTLARAERAAPRDEMSVRLPAPRIAPEPVEGPSSFGSVLDAVEGVNQDQLKADDALASFAAGENVDLHGTFIALEKADISLRAMVSVRDRALAAYEQIMNMSI